MQSFNFNEGYKEFCINGDETRVIRFNPSDLDIKTRLEDTQAELERFYSENSDSENIQSLIKEALKEAMNHIFNADCYDTIFGKQSPITPIGGKLLFENVLEGLSKIITPYIEEERKKLILRQNKYIKEARANANR